MIGESSTSGGIKEIAVRLSQMPLDCTYGRLSGANFVLGLPEQCGTAGRIICRSMLKQSKYVHAANYILPGVPEH